MDQKQSNPLNPNSYFSNGLTYRDATAIQILDRYNPTHFVTIRLLEGRWIYNENGTKVWIKGDSNIFQNAYCSIIRSLSKSLTSKHVWKRKKKALDTFGVLGGDGTTTNFHFHFFIEKPVHVNSARFCGNLVSSCLQNNWVNHSGEFCDVRRIKDECELKAKAYYIVDHGMDRFISA